MMPDEAAASSPARKNIARRPPPRVNFPISRTSPLMTDAPNAIVLDYLREQFARVNTKLDLLTADVGNLKGRVSGLEAEAGHTRVALAELNGRVDRVDSRLGRIERRLDLVDETAL